VVAGLPPDGPPAARGSWPRLFVAVWPSPAAVATLATALERPAVEGLRWTTPDQWHVTLRFLGAADPTPVAEALAPVAEGAGTPGGGTRSAVVAVAGPAVGHFGRQVLHLPVAGLDDLAAAVAAATTAWGPGDHPFRGHLTLARARRRARVDLGPWTAALLAVSWEVRELTLVASDTTAGGARYTILHRWPLDG